MLWKYLIKHNSNKKYITEIFIYISVTYLYYKYYIFIINITLRVFSLFFNNISKALYKICIKYV